MLMKRSNCKAKILEVSNKEFDTEYYRAIYDNYYC
jgi:hypothetical protein